MLFNGVTVELLYSQSDDWNAPVILSATGYGLGETTAFWVEVTDTLSVSQVAVLCDDGMGNWYHVALESVGGNAWLGGTSLPVSRFYAQGVDGAGNVTHSDWLIPVEYDLALDTELQSLSGDPGQVVTYSLSLTNTGPTTGTFVQALDKAEWPAGIWPQITPSLPPGASQQLSVTVQIPPDALGFAQDTLQVTTALSETAPWLSRSLVLTTTANVVYGIDMDTLPQTAFASPGELVTFTHQVTNTGNFTETFLPDCRSSLGWAVSCGTGIQLGLGEAAQSVMSVTIPLEAISNTVDTLLLTVTAVHDPEIFGTVSDRAIVGLAPGVSLSSGSQVAGLPGSTVTLTHTVTNTSNFTETILPGCRGDLEWSVSCGTALELAPNQSAQLLLVVEIPADTISSTVDTIWLTATIEDNPDVFAATLDRVIVASLPAVSLSAGYAQSGLPGAPLTFTHALTNTSNFTATFVLACENALGWEMDCPSLATELAPGQTTSVTTSVVVPAGVFSGTVNTMAVTVTIQAHPEAYAAIQDQVVVAPLSGASLSDGHEETGWPNSTITLTHTLTNTGNFTNTFELSCASAQDWRTDCPASITDLGPGQATEVVVGLSVPMGVLSDTLNTVWLTATIQASPAISAAVADRIIVGYLPGLTLSPGTAQNARPGSTLIFTHTITNTGNAAEFFDLTCSGAPGWEVECTPVVCLEAHQSVVIVVTVTVPFHPDVNTTFPVTVLATARSTPTVQVEQADIVEVIPFRTYLPLLVRKV